MPVCNICGCTTFVDMPPNSASIFLRPKAQCDGCGSLERHRLLYELLGTRGHLAGQRRVLHIAPEPGLGRMLRARFGDGYVACDADPNRYPGLEAIQLNLCDGLSRFPLGSFDIVIHNHVIEHVACDYRQVLRDLDMLVAPGGVHAFTVPFMEGGFRERIDAPDDAYRLTHFGQTDHVRVFSPVDAAATLGTLVPIPDPYDATALVSAARLAEMAIPQDQWRGYNNNAVFFLEKAGAGAVTAPAVPAAAASMPDGGKAVLFVSANGVGRGHITRQMAIAQRLTDRRPVFLTMSYAAGVIAREGFLVQFVPHHDATGEALASWHVNLSRDVTLLLERTGADTLVYDVPVVFDGLIEAMRDRPALRSFWIRRAMWPAHHKSYLIAGMHFSKIIEPGDLAEALDDGPTVAERSSVVTVPPVLRVEPGERMSRRAAREALGLAGDAPVIMLDLMSTSIASYADLRRRLLDRLLKEPETVIVELMPVFADTGRAPATERHRFVALDDSFRHSAAWDAAVVRCGYNTFHEHVLAGVPSLFVPNEAPDMDRQANRARWAEENGLGATIGVDADAGSIDKAASRLLDPRWRDGVKQASLSLSFRGVPWKNGATAIARLIDGMQI